MLVFGGICFASRSIKKQNLTSKGGGWNLKSISKKTQARFDTKKCHRMHFLGLFFAKFIRFYKKTRLPFPPEIAGKETK